MSTKRLYVLNSPGITLKGYGTKAKGDFFEGLPDEMYDELKDSPLFSTKPAPSSSVRSVAAAEETQEKDNKGKDLIDG